MSNTNAKIINDWINKRYASNNLLIADSKDNALIQFNKVIGLIDNDVVYINIEKYTKQIDSIQYICLAMLDGDSKVRYIDHEEIEKRYRDLRYKRMFE